MIKKIMFYFIGLSFFYSCNNINNQSNSYNIIPLPNKVEDRSGVFVLSGENKVSLPMNDIYLKMLNYLSDALTNTSIILLPVGESEDANIMFTIDNSLEAEAYILDVTSKGIEIKFNSSGAGLFYGIQSLIQLFPYDIYEASGNKMSQLTIPNVYIIDAPRFPYRGAMMDVARNFLPKETVFKFIDMMSLYKLNYLHLHLTNDQGWRIEIKKYPKLTEIGSHRSQTQIGHSDYFWPRIYDGIEHGGFYTQEEIKEIIQYASDRFITVVPEIEMPGHASAALASYPELSCQLESEYVVRDYFDIFDEVFCPKEKTFTFLENVLSEVIDLFPSHYIHIGGDECPKKAWKRCQHCQSLMKKEGLKSEEELQSWFIHRIEEFVNSKGRDIIGWDEILEGGLAPNATVMSWRGENGGITAAKQKHKVIMSPGYRCYFDFYQEDPEFAPMAMSGFLPIDSVYDYDPIPSILTADEQKYIIGTQANIWGEYIQTQDYFEYMAFPRLLAISEVQWTHPEHKKFEDFNRRLSHEFKRLDYYEVNASRNFYEVNFDGYWNKNSNQYEVRLYTFVPDVDVYYSINDSIVTSSSLLYSSPIKLDEDAIVYAKVFKDNKPLGRMTRKAYAINLVTGNEYSNTPEPISIHSNKKYGLTDGMRAYPTSWHKWVSYRQDTIQLTFNLKEKSTINEISFATLWRPWNYAWPSKGVKIQTSTDNINYTEIASEEFSYDLSATHAIRLPVKVDFPDTDATSVKVEIYSWGVCPPGYYREGEQTRTAIDEIEIK